MVVVSSLTLFCRIILQLMVQSIDFRVIRHQNKMVLLSIDIDMLSMAYTSVPTKYQTTAFKTNVFLINYLPSSAVKHKPPRELVFGSSPSLDFLRVFGCSCYPLLSPFGRSKLEYKSVYCVFLGYLAKHKGYCCLEPYFGHLFISRHVNFNELHFPLKTNTVSNSSTP